MAFYHFRATVRGLVALEGAYVALSGATVNLYQPTTANPVSFSVYQDSGFVTPLTNPITTGSTGIVDFYLQGPQTFDLVISSTGFNPIRVPLSEDANNAWLVPDGYDDFTNDTYTLPPLVSTSLPSTATAPYGG